MALGCTTQLLFCKTCRAPAMRAWLIVLARYGHALPRACSEWDLIGSSDCFGTQPSAVTDASGKQIFLYYSCVFPNNTQPPNPGLVLVAVSSDGLDFSAPSEIAVLSQVSPRVVLQT